MSLEDEVKELEALREKAREMGGKERLARQHARGRLDARTRIDKLLDPGSFVEFGLLARSHHPELRDLTAADGRICGTGTINGCRVAVVSFDRTILGGSGGSGAGARKTAMQEHLAVLGKYPLIRLADEAGGGRIQDLMGSRDWGMHAAGMGRGSGGNAGSGRRIPRVTAVMGECFGEPTIGAVTSDFAVMVKGTAMGLGGPKSIEPAIGQKVTLEEIGSWEVHARLTGQIDYVAENDEDCLNIIKDFLSYMPSNCDEEPSYVASQDDPYRRLSLESIGKLVTTDLNRSYDMYRLIKLIVDDGKYFPIKKEFAPSLITCLARMGGRVVGIYANNPLFNSGAPDIAACKKATEFICLCDSFNIPLICLMDIPGMFPGKEMERGGMPQVVVNWLAAQNLATVPRVTIAIRKQYAMGALVMMGSGSTGVVAAWPTARLSFVGPEIAINFAMQSKLKASEDPEAERERLTEEWTKQSAPWGAAEAYAIQDVIDPRNTRKFIVQSLEILRGNRDRVISEHRMQNWPYGF